jgi:hypothetical protein
MEPSAELRDLTLRLYRAVERGDAAFLERHVSRQEGVLLIGTDPDEWWEGLELLLAGQLQAYREGTVGWVIDRGPPLRLPTAQRSPSGIPWFSVGRKASGSSSTSTPPSGSGTRSCSGRTYSKEKGANTNSDNKLRL